MRITVTGGAGFIGSHCVVELLEKGHEVQIVDNFCNSTPETITGIREICDGSLTVVTLDLLEEDKLCNAFAQFQPEAVIHFAGLKAVGESTQKPLMYYDNNIGSTLCLLKAMDKYDCKHIIFSSSATVYGEPKYLPIDESHTCSPENAYGRTKYFIEEILKDWVFTSSQRKVIALRYFNPVGAHASSKIGESPVGIPNNLMPYISQVASGELEYLGVFGDDYDTPDGTGIRDYIHVVDLAQAHVAALPALNLTEGFEAINLGTGKGISVFEMVEEFEKASHCKIPMKTLPRRQGDIAESWANSDKAKELLKWQAKYNLYDMCSSAWAWKNSTQDKTA